MKIQKYVIRLGECISIEMYGQSLDYINCLRCEHGLNIKANIGSSTFMNQCDLLFFFGLSFRFNPAILLYIESIPIAPATPALMIGILSM